VSTVRAAAWMVGSAAIAKAKLIRMVDVLAVVKGADVVGIVEGIGEVAAAMEKDEGRVKSRRAAQVSGSSP